ncbi:MAG: hypothetical protein IPL65_08800 [Lewinellaceae bacterium]|nr:hypothetical protein [Lewinellaceae bacterium]
MDIPTLEFVLLDNQRPKGKTQFRVPVAVTLIPDNDPIVAFGAKKVTDFRQQKQPYSSLDFTTVRWLLKMMHPRFCGLARFAYRVEHEHARIQMQTIGKCGLNSQKSAPNRGLLLLLCVSKTSP